MAFVPYVVAIELLVRHTNLEHALATALVGFMSWVVLYLPTRSFVFRVNDEPAFRFVYYLLVQLVMQSARGLYVAALDARIDLSPLTLFVWLSVFGVTQTGLHFLISYLSIFRKR